MCYLTKPTSYLKIFHNLLKLNKYKPNHAKRRHLKKFLPVTANFDISKRHHSYIQHKYDKSIEKLMNTQIQDEFIAGYTYLHIATYFARSDVALPGIHAFFMKMFYEEVEHATQVIKYQTIRGGCVCLYTISCTPPSTFDLSTVFGTGLHMEKSIKEKLQNIHYVAGEKRDTDVQDFLDNMISHQELSIQEMARYYTRARLVGAEPVGKYLMDWELHRTHVSKNPTKHDLEYFVHKFYS